jgi:hypothetical protein
VDTIRADDPICFQQPAVEDCAVLTETRYGRVPEQIDSTLCCPVNHFLVKNGSPHTDPTLPRKPRFHRSRLVQEANSTEWLALARIYRNAQLTKRRQCARHQSFSARFVDRRLCAVSDCDLEAFPSRSDGHGQSCWASSCHYYVYPSPHELSDHRERISGPNIIPS